MLSKGEAVIIVEAVIRDKNGEIKETFQKEVTPDGNTD